ncbi:MAG: formylglycine-generating enzyme family protein [Nitrospinales bacterium]
MIALFMRRACILTVCFLLTSALAGSPAWAAVSKVDVPPKQQYRQLKKQLLKQIRAKDYAETLKALEAIGKLNMPISAALIFVKGEALLRTGKPAEAKIMLEKYIGKVGDKGKFFNKARKLLVEAEKEEKRLQARLRRKNQEPMVFIEGGTFQMGEENMGSVDNPLHTVSVDSFYLDRYEVTQEEFERVMGRNQSYFKAPDRPAEQVNWFDAAEYCKKVGKRLPTEAEWEYAARGGKKGGDPGGFWYRDNSGKESRPVGLLEPNALGLYDMLGNVWEWTADWYDAEYYRTGSTSNPKGPVVEESRGLRGAMPSDTLELGHPISVKYKVLRGGSWRNKKEFVRPGFRDYYTPDYRRSISGVRCARDK